MSSRGSKRRTTNINRVASGALCGTRHAPAACFYPRGGKNCSKESRGTAKCDARRRTAGSFPRKPTAAIIYAVGRVRIFFGNALSKRRSYGLYKLTRTVMPHNDMKKASNEPKLREGLRYVTRDEYAAFFGGPRRKRFPTSHPDDGYGPRAAIVTRTDADTRAPSSLEMRDYRMRRRYHFQAESTMYRAMELLHGSMLSAVDSGITDPTNYNVFVEAAQSIPTSYAKAMRDLAQLYSTLLNDSLALIDSVDTPITHVLPRDNPFIVGYYYDFENILYTLWDSSSRRANDEDVTQQYLLEMTQIVNNIKN